MLKGINRIEQINKIQWKEVAGQMCILKQFIIQVNSCYGSEKILRITKNWFIVYLIFSFFYVAADSFLDFLSGWNFYKNLFCFKVYVLSRCYLSYLTNPFWKG